MSIDEQIRAALRAKAERVEPGPSSWRRIQERVAAERRRRRARSRAVLGLTSAAVVMLVAGAMSVLGGNDSRLVETGPASAPPTPSTAVGGTPSEMDVTVFFSRTFFTDEELAAGTDTRTAVVPVSRQVPRTSGVLRAALEQLLAGPTDGERFRGLHSWFSEETAGMLNDVTIGPDGTAVVDFGDLRPVIPNASTSAGSDQLLAQLEATVFQFASVTGVEYRIDGSCEAFWEWLQRSCHTVVRPGR